MNRTSFSLASACSLALATFFMALVAHADGGGSFTDPNFMISLTNPCNGAVIEPQPITASAQVQVFGGDYAVAVESTFSGTVTDTSSRHYRLFGQAAAAYSTLSTHYVFPMLLDVDADQRRSELELYVAARHHRDRRFAAAFDRHRGNRCCQQLQITNSRGERASCRFNVR
jgi:hypothetical protein